MTTRRITETWQPCPECRGDGREWHGLVDGTCPACKGARVRVCPTPHCHGYVRHGMTVCDDCYRPAA